MNRRCVQCGTDFEVSVADAKRGVRMCTACERKAQRPRPRTAPPADLPKHVELDETPRRLRIGWRVEPSLGALFHGPALLVVTILSAATLPFRSASFGVAVILLLGAMTLHGFALLVGVFINRVEIVVEGGEIVASTKPLGRSRTVSRVGLEQIFVAPQYRTDKLFRIEARVRGERHLLLHSVSAERALFVERELERRLGIEDAPVDGEVPRRPARS